MVSGSLATLTTADNAFHGRVIVARLEAEGIRAQMRGACDWPWPSTGEVEVVVRAEELAAASEVLLFDQVDAAFDPPQARAVAVPASIRHHRLLLLALAVALAAGSTVTRWV